MGINANGLRFLLYAKRKGVNFDKVATIGRLTLNFTLQNFCDIVNGEFKENWSLDDIKKIHHYQYCELLLERLGAKSIDSFDYSNYENASKLHDFNKEIGEEHHNQYTTVLEGGTIEHVFNPQVAIKNCMQMVKVEGHYLGLSSPTNNYMGHGFYQFSPEFFFQALNSQNGFEVNQVILVEGRETKKWYKVTSPEKAKNRVGTCNYRRSNLIVFATKKSNTQIFSQPPQQTDYLSIWEKEQPKDTPKKQKKGAFTIFKTIKRDLKTLLGREKRPPYFTPFDYLS